MRRIGESADLRMREGAAQTETKCLMGSERFKIKLHRHDGRGLA